LAVITLRHRNSRCGQKEFELNGLGGGSWELRRLVAGGGGGPLGAGLKGRVEDDEPGGSALTKSAKWE